MVTVSHEGKNEIQTRSHCPSGRQPDRAGSRAGTAVVPGHVGNPHMVIPTTCRAGLTRASDSNSDGDREKDRERER
jgi:hypothetical protein